MVVYARVVDKQFNVHTYFLKNITIKNPKSDAQVLFDTITNYLEEEGLDITKLLGFGSDGASVMIGRHKGVATRIKERSPHCVSVHCMAHRFNLCTSQASNGIPYLKEFEKTLTDLYYYFGGSKSGNRKCELEEIQKILDDPQVTIKECHEIRWIAFYQAVKAVHISWNALVTYFQKHKYKDFLQRLTHYKFVACLHILMDVLPSVSSMSQMLQKQSIDIAALRPAMSALKVRIRLASKGQSPNQTEFLQKLVTSSKSDQGETDKVTFKGHQLYVGQNSKREVADIRASFGKALIDNIDRRFPEDVIDVTSAFSIFGLKTNLADKVIRDSYGDKELDLLIKHYGNTAKRGDVSSPPLVDGDLCRVEWGLAKTLVVTQNYQSQQTDSCLLWKTLHMFHSESLPNILKLANASLIMPYQTADCERGFSAQNLIKTSRRSLIQEERLNILMTIKIEGAPWNEFDFVPVIEKWKKKKERRLFNYVN